MDDDELEEIEEKLEMDYQIGEDFKEKVNPLELDRVTNPLTETTPSLADNPPRDRLLHRQGSRIRDL